MGSFDITSQSLAALQREIHFDSATPQDREDALQEALIVATESYDPAQGPLAPFVKAVAYHDLIDATRAHSAEPVGLVDEDHANYPVSDPRQEIHPEQLDELPDLYRLLFKQEKRLSLLALSPVKSIRLSAQRELVVLKKLVAMIESGEIDEHPNPKELWEGPLYQEVVNAGHKISPKTMWDVKRFAVEHFVR